MGAQRISGVGVCGEMSDLSIAWTGEWMNVRETTTAYRAVRAIRRAAAPRRSSRLLPRSCGRSLRSAPVRSRTRGALGAPSPLSAACVRARCKFFCGWVRKTLDSARDCTSICAACAKPIGNAPVLVNDVGVGRKTEL